MKTVRVAILLLTASFVRTSPAQSQLRGGPVEATAVAAPRQQLELAGIRIGMAYAEVSPVLAAAGYRPHQSGEGPSWDATVARRASERGVRLEATGRAPAWGSYLKGVERVEVQYRPTPTGTVVSEVSYTINADAITSQRLRAVLLGRYGRAGWENGVEFLYCSRGERVCNLLAYGHGLQLPSVYVQIGPMQHWIRLQTGARIAAAYDAVLQAEVDRRAPRVNRPAF
jgi:hypothetical protein